MAIFDYIPKNYIYLAIFMTGVWLIYFIIPKKWRYLVLLAASFTFLGLISGWLSLWVAYSSLVIYLIGLMLDKLNTISKNEKDNLSHDEWQKYKVKSKRIKNGWLALGILLDLGALVGLKYTNFFITIWDKIATSANWLTIATYYAVIPLGISYYTLQSIGYMIDIRRGKYQANKNFFKVALFVGYFPQMLEGPIGRYDQMKDTLLDGNSKASIDNYARGMLQILYGLFKKIVIADRLGIYVSAIFASYASYSSWAIFLAILAFTGELYCEFSGIIDVVSGVSMTFGIKLADNFKQPFFATSVSEFWRRWHISLGTWFRDYVFYPLSMSKLSLKMNKANSKWMNPFWSTYFPTALWIVLIWSLTGLWHGASLKYIFYGFYYGVIMALEMIWDHYTLDKKFRNTWWYKAIAITVTFCMVNVGMMFFKADGLHAAYNIFLSLFKIQYYDLFAILDWKELTLVIVAYCIVLAVDICYEKKFDIREFFVAKHHVWLFVIYAVLIITIIFLGAYGTGYIGYDPIYGGF